MSIPLIIITLAYGLTDLEHPCQALGDLLTLKEKGKLKKGTKFVFVGHPGFNMANSLMLATTLMGMNCTIIGPRGYSPNEKYFSRAKKLGNVEYTHDMNSGMKNADVVYTDVWVSMGQEDEKADLIRDFTPYQINKQTMGLAKKDAVFMHCLPAHRGMEVTKEVLEGKKSVVFDQAENRLHIQKAILLKLLE